ncbi:CidA/LrgA family protein [Chromohalobacter sp. HP20-39]|uniref:CidA/LrgA family protein n=1 Tax=Chromohalobacter sp. HP20-39 TaxID=3079306 RepID=UPI00294B34DC|nr:CidA/LrgA family protein [Chromohalobacter sp. HP20-39]MDV6318129.1 CidA/LrgA family protein [Chromohalobacter sp. HP20-39]
MLSILRGFFGLSAFLLLGDIVVRLFALPLSSGVAGMLLLTVWLLLRRRLSPDLTAASQPLIGMLALLIMPGVVGIFFQASEFAGHWPTIFAALIAGTLLSSWTTLWLMRRLVPRAENDVHE